MSRHLAAEIAALKTQLLHLAAVVEQAVRNAVKALEEGDTGLAASIIDGDIEIDHTEVRFEEECLKVLALHQPVAGDLRFIVAILKINSDLERVGDLAVHMAEKAISLSRQAVIGIPEGFGAMAEKSQAMLVRSIGAFVSLDTDLARSISAGDDEVDDMNRTISRRIKVEMRAHPENLDALMDVLSVSRNVERIADHATNIAEDVIYLVEGEIVRHKEKEAKSPGGGTNPANK
jgi:phosphate transport system protein